MRSLIMAAMVSTVVVCAGVSQADNPVDYYATVGASTLRIPSEGYSQFKVRGATCVVLPKLAYNHRELLCVDSEGYIASRTVACVAGAINHDSSMPLWIDNVYVGLTCKAN